MSRGTTRRAAAALAIALLAFAWLGAGLGSAERNGRDGVQVSLDGSVSPRRLPRHRSVPVSLTLEGSISSETSPAPLLRSIEVAFGARGGFSTTGLPRCTQARLRNSTHAQALASCRSALLGRGTVLTESILDPQRPVTAHAQVLAFNGKTGGRSAILVQGYSSSPPVSFVIPFYLRRVKAGGYGVLMEAPIAQPLGPWLRLRSFKVIFGRRYRLHGRQRSFLTASCPLPPRLHIGFFALARATYDFEPAPTLTTTILRSCRASD